MGRNFISALIVAAVASMASAQDETFRYASDSLPGDATELTDSTVDESESFQSYNQKLVKPRVQRAKFKAEQRRLLIASRNWYGHSAARPVLAANPYATGYVPFYPVVPVAIVTQAQQPLRTYSGAYGWY